MFLKDLLDSSDQWVSRWSTLVFSPNNHFAGAGSAITAAPAGILFVGNQILAFISAHLLAISVFATLYPDVFRAHIKPDIDSRIEASLAVFAVSCLLQLAIVFAAAALTYRLYRTPNTQFIPHLNAFFDSSVVEPLAATGAAIVCLGNHAWVHCS